MRTWDRTSRITKGQPVDPSKKEEARRMRREPTPSEQLAWSLLRNRQVLGLKFRRQQVILGFIADFYCAEERLVLEVDGSSHGPLSAQAYDEERTAILASLELRVVRIKNEDLSIDALTALISGCRHPLSLQGEGEGG